MILNKCNFNMNRQRQKNERLGEEKLNNQGCLMKIIEYKDSMNLAIEFQDRYKTKIYTRYEHFIDGSIKNPYYPNVFGVGMIGSKYPSRINNIKTKEYKTWHAMLKRCFDENTKKQQPAYQNVTCCKKWLLYENFYEWLHSQENFNKWLNGERWCLDKDILVKGSKIYSPETCCLVPSNVNTLFVKNNVDRGDLPIGVGKRRDNFFVQLSNSLENKHEYLGTYQTLEKAFLTYKKRKEEIIKQVANIEYDLGNISKSCYEAMMHYEVEIDD